MLLEICAYNIQSCIIAEKAGAGRIELCADPSAGGTTPSFGLIEYCLEHISIPVFPMIRPRGGNFIYDSHELDIMKKDILKCREMGCMGIATGIQLGNNTIDTENLARMVDWAGGMEVTCHKVFDRAPDAIAALDAVMAAGCSRILTSGLGATAIEGAAVLKQLISHAGGWIIIMPGGGVRSSNIASLISLTGAAEYHSSGLTGKTGGYVADEEEIKAILNLII